MNRLTSNSERRNKKIIKRKDPRISKGISLYATDNTKNSINSPLFNNHSLLVAFLLIIISVFTLNRETIAAYFTDIDYISNLFSINANYNITFNGNSGSGNMSPQEISYNVETPLKLNEFTKTGYHFDSWNTKSDGTGNSYSDGETVNNLGNKMLYLQWIPNEYNVVFHSNFNSDTTINQTMVYDTQDNLRNNTFNRTGYTFNGWNTNSLGTGTDYSNGQSVLNLVTSGSFDLYAKWLANTYTVIFDSNGGTGTMSPQTFTYDVADNLTANSFTNSNSNYIFDGWNTEANGSGNSYDDEDSVINLVSSGNITLYAQWKYYLAPKKGDVVNYTPTASTTNSSYSGFVNGTYGYSANNSTYYLTATSVGLTGNLSEKTFTQDNFEWKIWDIDDDKVRLVSTTATTQKLSLTKLKGFDNGLFFMNDICSKLYAGDVDGITAKNLTFKDIEEKIILNYAAEHPNATGFVDGQGKVIWSEANVSTILGLTDYGSVISLSNSNGQSRKYMPTVFANEDFDHESNGVGTPIEILDADMSEDYRNGTYFPMPLTNNPYWTGKDSSPGTKRPLSMKSSYYSITTNATNYFDSIDEDLIFIDTNYWLSTKSIQESQVSSTESMKFYLRYVSSNNQLLQYEYHELVGNSTGTGTTNVLSLRPIVTIDRSKFDLLYADVDEWDLAAK